MIMFIIIGLYYGIGLMYSLQECEFDVLGIGVLLREFHKQARNASVDCVVLFEKATMTKKLYYLLVANGTGIAIVIGSILIYALYFVSVVLTISVWPILFAMEVSKNK